MCCIFGYNRYNVGGGCPPSYFLLFTEDIQMTNEELREQLLMAPKNGFSRITPEDRANMEVFAKDYMAFIDACKTEREATAWAVAEA